MVCLPWSSYSCLLKSRAGLISITVRGGMAWVAEDGGDEGVQSKLQMYCTKYTATLAFDCLEMTLGRVQDPVLICGGSGRKWQAGHTDGQRRRLNTTAMQWHQHYPRDRCPISSSSPSSPSQHGSSFGLSSTLHHPSPSCLPLWDSPYSHSLLRCI